MSSLPEIAQGFVSTLEPLRQELTKLQIVPRMMLEPTPPAIDVYPADPFMAESTMGEPVQSWIVRARTSTADNEAGQRSLLRFMDLEDALSVSQALLADPTLDETVGNIDVDFPTGFQSFVDPSGEGFLLGVTWRVEVYP